MRKRKEQLIDGVWLECELLAQEWKKLEDWEREGRKVDWMSRMIESERWGIKQWQDNFGTVQKIFHQLPTCPTIYQEYRITIPYHHSQLQTKYFATNLLTINFTTYFQKLALSSSRQYIPTYLSHRYYHIHPTLNSFSTSKNIFKIWHHQLQIHPTLTMLKNLILIFERSPKTYKLHCIALSYITGITSQTQDSQQAL